MAMTSASVTTDRSTRLPSGLLQRLTIGVAIVYLSLLVYNQTDRTGRFSPDSMSYVNVAQNVISGKGLTQPTVGFNQPRFPLEEKPPVPFVAQAPLYPTMIALVSRIGIAPPRAALLLAALAMAAIFLLTFMVATEFYDPTVGLAAAALLLFYHPMRWMNGWAWNDPIGVVLVLATFWLLARTRNAPNRILILAAAGFVGGLGFAIRFALLPLPAIGALFLVFARRTWRAKLADLALYTLGFAVPSGIVLARSFLLTGSFAPPFNPVRVAFSENVNVVIQTVFGHYAEALSYQHQFALLGLSLIGIFIAFAIRRQFVRSIADIFTRERRWILLVWSFGYLLFLVVQRSRSFFDVDARTIAPAGIVLLILWSAAAVRATRIPPPGIASIALVLLLLAIGQETAATMSRPRLNLERHVQTSQRLAWIASNTSDQDLIIGDDVVDIPFFLHRPATLSFSPYPYTDYADYEKIMAYARMHCSDYRTIFLVLRNFATEEDWRAAFGDFFADLIGGKADKYPGIVPLQTLNGALVFQVVCR